MKIYVCAAIQAVTCIFTSVVPFVGRHFFYAEKVNMEKKFTITSKKYRGEGVVVSVRLPDDMIKAIDKTAEETGRTRNEVIIKSLSFAIDNLEIKEESDG